MNKKQILSTVLAGLITLNTLGGCTNSNKVSSSVSTDTSIEDVVNDYKENLPKYDIVTYLATMTTNEDESVSYSKPDIKKYENGILVGNRIYCVYELNDNKTAYETVINQEDAVKIVNDYIKATHIDIEDKEIYEDSYRITTMDVSNFYNEKGEILYKLPNGFIAKDEKAYKVEELVTNTVSYPAVNILEDGTEVYCAPLGGVLEGNLAVIKTSNYEPVTGDKAQEIIDNYLSENSLKLEK